MTVQGEESGREEPFGDVFLNFEPSAIEAGESEPPDGVFFVVNALQSVEPGLHGVLLK